ncbi:MAG: acyltransferase [Mycobacterium sp.]
MFGATPIRYLSPSEEFYAQAENFIGLTLTLRGALDVGAMSEAFDTLLRVHPAHAGHLERDADGRHQIMVDDYEHEGIWLEKPGDEPGGRLPSQTEALLNLRIRLGEDRSTLTLYTHHALADGHHQFALLEQLFGWYTDIVSGAGVGTVKAEPIPESLEAVLAERGIGKLARFGLERFLPAIFAYDLPPSKRNAGRVGPQSVRVPSASCRLSQQETKDLAGVCADRRISVNAVVAAAILMAEWRIRETPHLPIPYIYPVDLRFFLTPPVGATEATNPLGMAMFLAEIRSDTDLMDLARDILEAFRADLADGVIQQSFLHFGTEYQGNPPGLPDVVMATDGGDLPPLRTPPGLVVEQYDLEVLFASTAAGVDMYSAGTYDGQLLVSYNSHGPEPQRYVAEIRDLLTAVPAAHGRVTD